ncbi:MAG: polyhydroxyalkanoate synthesis repressor PhaR [Hyphomicrobiaceae bacterium]
MLNTADNSGSDKEAVIVKKYANRRLYNTETSTYVTLEDLANMVREDRDFIVYDAKSGDDLTHAVLTQIIVEQESRAGQTLLPTPFLRQLIRFYDDSMSRMVPGYLQFSLEALAKEQEKYRSQFANSFTNPTAAFDVYKEHAARNMEIFEKAMSLWSPFGLTKGAEADTDETSQTATSKTEKSDVDDHSGGSELKELKDQLSAMQKKIEKLSETGKS